MTKQLQDYTREELIDHIAELKRVIIVQHQALSKISDEANNTIEGVVDESDLEARFYQALGGVSILGVMARNAIEAVS
jgi:hypothetical protein